MDDYDDRVGRAFLDALWNTQKKSEEIKVENEQQLPTSGTLYTVYDFIEHCGKGLLLDTDGKGYYSDGRVYWLDQEARPSDIVEGKLRFSYKFRYVVWFEK